MPYQNDNELTETDIHIEELNNTITSLRIQISELKRNISNLEMNWERQQSCNNSLMV